MVTLQFTKAEAQALGDLIILGEDDTDQEALRTANNKLTRAIENHGRDVLAVTVMGFAVDGRMTLTVDRGSSEPDVLYLPVEMAEQLAADIRYVIASRNDPKRTIGRIDAVLGNAKAD